MEKFSTLEEVKKSTQEICENLKNRKIVSVGKKYIKVLNIYTQDVDNYTLNDFNFVFCNDYRIFSK
jgi:hypothetical protein